MHSKHSKVAKRLAGSGNQKETSKASKESAVYSEAGEGDHVVSVGHGNKLDFILNPWETMKGF